MIKNKIFPFYASMIPGDVGMASDPAGVAASFAQAAPAPPPPPSKQEVYVPPAFPTGAVQEKTTKGGKTIKIGQFGNRLDTAAGAAREAEMQAAAYALQVAHSEAVHGRKDSAQEALQKAQLATINATGMYNPKFPNAANNQNFKTFTQTVANQTADISRIINTPQQPAPDPGKPKPKPEPGPSETPRSFNPIISQPPQTIAPPSPVLLPGRDVINFQTEPVSVEAMEQILFEQIGGYELINLVRRDTVEGQNPFYTLISNLSSIRRQLDPAQIISLQQPNRTGFEIYEINLDERIPGDQYLQNNNISNFFYIDDNGDLVIELENMQNDEEIEVQMANSGKIT